jgi:hypothetical protein
VLKELDGRKSFANQGKSAIDSGGCQSKLVSHALDAAPAKSFCDDLSNHAHLVRRVVASEIDPPSAVNPISDVNLAPIVAEIREQWRRRQAWHRAEKSLTLQAKALCRRLAHEGDKVEADKIYKAALGKGEHPSAHIALAAIFPLTEARDSVEKHRKIVEKRLVLLAKQIPASEWTEGIRGVGLRSLASIVGEAGDLSHYSNPAKLWKRMGLAVMPDGGRQRRIAGPEALEHGYSPSRRSVVWNIGDCIIKTGGLYRAVYDARKEIEAKRTDQKAISHARAKRYMEKRFLRDLWAVWRRQTLLPVNTAKTVSDADFSSALVGSSAAMCEAS